MMRLRSAAVVAALGPVAVLLGFALTAPAPARAQAPPLVDVAEARADRDGDHVPDRLGQILWVEGVLTSEPRRAGREYTLGNLQDSTGGLLLFETDTTRLLKLSAGDRVRLRGEIDQYRGAEELIVDSVVHIGHPGVPEPVDVLAEELAGDAYANQLVRIAGTLHAERTPDGAIRAWLEDRTGRIAIGVPVRWLGDGPIIRRLLNGGTVNLVGVQTQITDSDPPTDGYIVYPREPSDITYPPVPPYGLLIGIAAVLLLLGAGAFHVRERSRRRRLQELTEELKASQQALEAREERYRSLVENAADTVAILSPDGIVEYQSPSVRRTLGWSAEDVEGHSIFEDMHPDDVGAVRALLSEIVADPWGHGEADVRLRSRDGSWRHLEVVAANRLEEPSIRGIVCNIRDVTQHKELEERLRRADRLEVVGRLAGGIAHDFNNVLTALRGYAQLALDEMSDEAVGRVEVQEIAKAADRAASLTRQLLAFTRQQVLQPKVLSPGDVVEEMVPMLRRLIGEDIGLVTDVADDAGSVEVDPSQLEQVVMNLVVNARDAMPAGGTVTIRVHDDAISRQQADEHPYQVIPGAYVRVSVEDTGEGMTEDVLARVFEPFFTTKEQGKGTGLGLATLYGIVKQSGGYVWAESDPGEGSRFDVFLPRLEQVHPEEPGPGHGDGEREPPEGGEGELVLLVEDEAGVRELARRVLERNGYQVREAEDADSALRWVEESGSHVDLLLTDVVMPGMSGGSLAQQLRQRFPGLPTVYTSGYTADEVVRRGVVTGDAHYMEKPFTPNTLLRYVRATLSRA